MHDLVNNRLFDVDFKMENQKYFVTLCCTTSKKGKKNTMQALVRNYPTYMMKKLSNYGSVRIGLLNFTANEDVKSFLEPFFVEKDGLSWIGNREVAWKVAKWTTYR